MPPLHLPVEVFLFYFCFFNDTATTEIYTLSLHDALPIWDRRVAARLDGRHSEDAEKGRELDRPTQGAADPAVELPPHRLVADIRPAPVGGKHLVDRDRERLPWAGTPDFDRPGERVTLVLRVVPRREALLAGQMPAPVRRREADGVARVDREHRLEVAREVPVEDARLQRQLVQH